MEDQNTNEHKDDDVEEAVATAESILRFMLSQQIPEKSIEKPEEPTPSTNLSGSATQSQPPQASLSKSEQILKNIKIDSRLIKSLNLASISFQHNLSNAENTVINLNVTENSESKTEHVKKIILSYLNRMKDATQDDEEHNSQVGETINQPIIVNPVTLIIEPDVGNTGPTETETASIAKVHKPLPQVTAGKGVQKPASLEPIRVDSLSSFGSNVCRICMTKGKERLVSPCHCKGSMGNVHLSCLERWLNQVGRNQCELCGFTYPAIRTPRYTVAQALRLWFGNPRNRNHLQSDCLIFWLLSTVTAALLAVCIYGTHYFVLEGNKFGKFDVGVSRRLTETAMDLFMALVLLGYSVTGYLLWKDHYSMWNRWRRTNVNVRLLLSPDASPVPFVPRAPLQV